MTRLGRKGWLVVDNENIGHADGFKELVPATHDVSSPIDGRSLRRTITGSHPSPAGHALYAQALNLAEIV